MNFGSESAVELKTVGCVSDVKFGLSKRFAAVLGFKFGNFFMKMVGFCGDLPVRIRLDGGEDFIDALTFTGELLLIFDNFDLALLVFFFTDFKNTR